MSNIQKLLACHLNAAAEWFKRTFAVLKLSLGHASSNKSLSGK